MAKTPSRSPSPGRSLTPGRSSPPVRASTPGRSSTPGGNSVCSDSPRVSDEQGSTWKATKPQLRRSPSVKSADAAPIREAYALFRPEEVLSGRQSAKLRRLEEDVVDLRLDDVYSALSNPWQLDRNDVNGPHSSGEWTDGVSPEYCVSSDTGRICFAPVSGRSETVQGQYHKTVTESWRSFTQQSEAPGNVGGFHGCCIDTGQPGTRWILVARLADFGMVMGREAGLRVEFAALVRNDCEALVASVGQHDECRSLFCVDELCLPSGRLLLADPAELPSLGTSSRQAAGSADEEEEEEEEVSVSTVPCGLGAGYYPVVASRDKDNRICRVSLVFHPSRMAKICLRFPPEISSPRSRPASGSGDPSGCSASQTTMESASKPPLAPGKPPHPKPGSGSRPRPRGGLLT